MAFGVLNLQFSIKLNTELCVFRHIHFDLIDVYILSFRFILDRESDQVLAAPNKAHINTIFSGINSEHIIQKNYEKYPPKVTLPFVARYVIS